MRRIYILLALFGVCFSAVGQDRISNQQVEVTREYTPEVQGAVKLTPAPNMVDTVKLYPESNYTVYPTAWTTSFGVKAFKPVRLDMGGAEAQTPFYVKLGAGLSANSVADLYASSNWDGGAVVGYVNHRGYYGKIENDLGDKVSAPYSTNTIGINLEQASGSYQKFTGELAFDYDYLTRYGAYVPENIVNLSSESFSPESFSYSTIKANLFYGDDFKDLSRLNYGFDLGAYYFKQKDFGEADINFKATVAKKFGVHAFKLGASIEGTFGQGDLDYYENTTFGLSPRYMIDTERFGLSVGVDYYYDKLMDNGESHLFPVFMITYKSESGSFTPYFSLDGELERNGYKNLTLQNPYVMAGYTTDNNAIYKAHVGINGNLSGSFSYELYAGLDLYRKLNNFVSYYSGDEIASFIAFADKASCFVLGADIEARLSRGLTLDLGAKYSGYDLKNVDKVSSRPSFEANLLLSYAVHNKFSLRLGADFIGTRYFYDLGDFSSLTEEQTVTDYLTMIKKGSVVDLSLAVDYRVSPLVIVFAEGSNLANAELYPYNHYKGFGANFTLGAKLTF